jgi:Ca2+-binding RTX toxin-like protein
MSRLREEDGHRHGERPDRRYREGRRSTFDDVFFGGKDDDVFVGGDGDNWFRGMEGQDKFTGGAGNDTFVWETRDVVKGKNALGPDTITDFSSGDVLDLSAITRGGSAESVARLTETEAGSMLSVKVG